MWLVRLAVVCGVVCACVSLPLGDPSLEQVHVFFRHGDRTPDKKDFYPTDPYANYSFYPMGLGQLSNTGKYREFRLGEMLRKRYHNLLGDIYSPEMLEASSSDFARTKMSLMLVLAGLWPPAVEQQWNNALLWQPIPFNYKTAADDHLIQRPNSYCPRYMQELEAVVASEDVQRYIKENQELFEYVEKWTGKPMTKPIHIFDVYQNLNAEFTLNLTLPDWTREVYPEPLQSVAAMQIKFENYNDVLIRLNGGHSLKYVLDNTKRKIRHDKDFFEKKIILVSGHENNVVNVLTTLGAFEPHVPVYGSAVLFELYKYKGTEEYVFKVLYYDQKSETPRVLKLKDCNELCPLDQFIALTSRYVPLNYTAECQSEVNLD